MASVPGPGSGRMIGERPRVTGRKRRNWVLAGIAGLAAALIAFAWIDGGEEPLRPIAQPIPLPEIVR